MKRTEVNSICERGKSSGGSAGQLTTNQNYLNAAVKRKEEAEEEEEAVIGRLKVWINEHDVTLSRVIYGTESRDDDTAAVMKNIFMMNDKNLRGWVGGKKKKRSAEFHIKFKRHAQE